MRSFIYGLIFTSSYPLVACLPLTDVLEGTQLCIQCVYLRVRCVHVCECVCAGIMQHICVVCACVYGRVRAASVCVCTTYVQPCTHTCTTCACVQGCVQA